LNETVACKTFPYFQLYVSANVRDSADDVNHQAKYSEVAVMLHASDAV